LSFFFKPKEEAGVRKIVAVKRVCSVIVALTFSLGCVSTGPVETELNDSLNKVFNSPPNFVSPQGLLREGLDYLKKYKGQKLSRDNLFLAKALLELYKQQNAIRQILSEQGEISLKPGSSYQFSLQSFCVHAGKNRPLKGDGLNSAPLKGAPSKWLPQILKNYASKNIRQPDAQLLIWSLLSGLKYDELPPSQKANLRSIFPDAPILFGNRFVEDEAKSIISGYLPSEITSSVDKMTALRSKIENVQNSFTQIEEVFAPPADHQTPIPVGWLKTPEGLMMHLESNGYQEVGVKLYVPPELKTEPHFRPAEIITIPAEGQRLAVSPNSTDSENEYLDPALKELFKWVAGRKIEPSELNLIKKYPADAIRAFFDAQKAVGRTEDIFKNLNSFHNNESDAFRHFYWSSRLSSHLGVDQAERNMDLYNNHMGEKFVKDFQGKNDAMPTDSDIERRGLELLRRKELRVIDPTGEVPELSK
jgi:hypothetical protein